MSISDEQLYAYVDGELPDAQRALVEQAISQDPDIAQRIARERALRDRLRATFEPVLQEPAPDRFIGLVKNTKLDAVAPVADIAAAREQARRPAPAMLSSKSGWFAIAASVLVGCIAALLATRWKPEADLTAFKDGKLVARGALASALDQQLASAIPANAHVRIGLSFKARSGRYCRTFEFAGAEATAGLACYDQEHWRVLTLIEKPAKEGSDPAYRMAGSDLPPLLLQSVSDNISGEPLDAAAEMRARSAGWH